MYIVWLMVEGVFVLIFSIFRSWLRSIPGRVGESNFMKGQFCTDVYIGVGGYLLCVSRIRIFM